MAFLKDYGALTVAGIALLQPWVGYVWRRYFRRGAVRVFETGNIEIGFSAYGPTIGLLGTMRCVQRDLFVQRMQLLVEREKDRARHEFDWVVFRSEKISGSEPASLEIPHAFMLTTTLPRPYNIQFHDAVAQKDMRTVLSALTEAWNTQFQAAAKQDARMLVADPAQAGEIRRALYEQFSQSMEHVKAYAALNRVFYWEPGGYTVSLRITTGDPDRTHVQQWRFVLQDADADALRLNIIPSMRDTLQVPPPGFYNFAYPEYVTGTPEP